MNAQLTTLAFVICILLHSVQGTEDEDHHIDDDHCLDEGHFCLHVTRDQKLTLGDWSVEHKERLFSIEAHRINRSHAWYFELNPDVTEATITIQFTSKDSESSKGLRIKKDKSQNLKLEIVYKKENGKWDPLQEGKMKEFFNGDISHHHSYQVLTSIGFAKLFRFEKMQFMIRVEINGSWASGQKLATDVRTPEEYYVFRSKRDVHGLQRADATSNVWLIAIIAIVAAVSVVAIILLTVWIVMRHRRIKITSTRNEDTFVSTAT